MYVRCVCKLPQMFPGSRVQVCGAGPALHEEALFIWVSAAVSALAEVSQQLGPYGVVPLYSLVGRPDCWH